MRLNKLRLNYLSVVKYLCIFLLFLIFNNLERKIAPYSSALLVALLYHGASLITTPIFYLLSFLVLGKVGLILPCGIFALFFIIVFIIYRKFNAKPNATIIPLTIIALTPYLVLGDNAVFSTIIERIISSCFILLLTLLFCIALNTFNKKGLKFKYAPHEKIILATILVAFGVGLSNFTSPLVFKAISFFLILTVSYLYKAGTCSFFSACLGISFSVYYQNVVFLSVFIAWSIASSLIMPLSRHLSSVAIIAVDILVNALFSVYPAYSVLDVISGAIGSLCFSFIPTSIFKSLKEKLYAFREKQLSRQSINRNRTLLSNRLFQLSNVFSEMSYAFEAFEKGVISNEKAKDVICNKICLDVCEKCQNHNKCLTNDLKNELLKLTAVGLAKGKVSIIDLPKKIGQGCIRPNEIIFPLNKLLAEYRSSLIEKQNIANGRKILAEETEGISMVLRTLALESGTLLKYQSRLERLLTDELMKNGISVSELLIYGEEDNLSIGLIITMKEIPLETVIQVISKSLGKNMCLVEKVDISEDKIYFHFKKSADYDAVFGISHSTKLGSNSSGDTHSVARLKEDKFLIALSDGMGSGEWAKKTSSTSLSLIEGFYKAGIKGELVLSTVNKLLAINTEDNFTALDVAVVDLTNATADFIKYGTPYGFIIGEEGIRIIEGNTLPLGILTELKPAICKAQLSDGDMIIFLTDGISDAFGSSGEVIEFLKTVPAKNPQTLTDEILKKALAISNGTPKDDMTALAVRIYKRDKSA